MHRLTENPRRFLMKINTRTAVQGLSSPTNLWPKSHRGDLNWNTRRWRHCFFSKKKKMLKFPIFFWLCFYRKISFHVLCRSTGVRMSAGIGRIGFIIGRFHAVRPTVEAEFIGRGCGCCGSGRRNGRSGRTWCQRRIRSRPRPLQSVRRRPGTNFPDWSVAFLRSCCKSCLLGHPKKKNKKINWLARRVLTKSLTWWKKVTWWTSPINLRWSTGAPFADFWLIYPKYQPARGGTRRSARSLADYPEFSFFDCLKPLGSVHFDDH